jgi:hypothetical protein
MYEAAVYENLDVINHHVHTTRPDETYVIYHHSSKYGISVTYNCDTGEYRIKHVGKAEVVSHDLDIIVA